MGYHSPDYSIKNEKKQLYHQNKTTIIDTSAKTKFTSKSTLNIAS